MDDMKITRDLFNLRIWGNFNPAILSHSFLSELNALPEDAHVPEPVITPFVSSLDYKERGLKVLADTDSFLVSHKPGECEVIEAVRLARAYLATLEYTPVKKVSFNFCGHVEFPTIAEGADKFEAWLLRDREGLMSSLQAERLRMAVQLMYDSEGFEVIVRLGPKKESRLPFLLWQDKNVSDAREATLCLAREIESPRMVKACETQLRNLFKGGLSCG